MSALYKAPYIYIVPLDLVPITQGEESKGFDCKFQT